MATEAKKPRTRAFAPKARSGCLTCKKRRKKCDEGRPVCDRCRTGGFVCDGYEHTHQALDAATSPVNARNVLYRQKIPGNAMHNFYRHHFFCHTVPDLTDMHDSTSFWRGNVVAFHQRSAFIEPAILALGAAHWMFLSRIEPLQVRNLTNTQYNEAIRRLLPAMTDTGSGLVDISAITMCCLLFICIDCLRDNQSEALRHMEAGSQLFLAQLNPLTSTKAELEPLEEIFHMIREQSSLMADRPLCPDPAPHLSALEPQELCAEEYMSLYEAKEALDRLDSCFHQFIHNEALHCHAYFEDKCNCPEHCQCLSCQEWDALDMQVKCFRHRFRPLAEKQADTENLQAQQQLLRLQLLDKVWQWTMASQQPPGEDGMDIDTMGELLGMVERILGLFKARPTFSLSADVIPTLIALYEFSPTDLYRQKVIDLLRSHPRREVIFSSGQVAAFLENHMSRLRQAEGNSGARAVVPSKWPQALINFAPCTGM